MSKIKVVSLTSPGKAPKTSRTILPIWKRSSTAKEDQRFHTLCHSSLWVNGRVCANSAKTQTLCARIIPFSITITWWYFHQTQLNFGRCTTWAPFGLSPTVSCTFQIQEYNSCAQMVEQLASYANKWKLSGFALFSSPSFSFLHQFSYIQ